MYRDNVDDPYRSRKDHKFNNADAYHYDHMSNNSQQRQQHPQQQPPHQHHSTIHHSRKSSISSMLPQKYYAMVSMGIIQSLPAFSLASWHPPPSSSHNGPVVQQRLKIPISFLLLEAKSERQEKCNPRLY